jgi:hypothetical protein
MEFKELPTLLTFLFGAGFTLMDIGIDNLLVYEYASKEYDNRTLETLYNLYDEHFSKQQAPYLLVFYFDVRRCLPSNLFTFLTAMWIILGGMGQTATIIHFHRKKDPLLSTLPTPVRQLVCCTAPILLAPVVLNIYGAYLVLKKKPDVEILKTKKLMSALKMAAVVLESTPQLTTQWNAVLVNVLESKGSQEIVSGMSSLQCISIVTSTTTILTTFINWISLLRSRQFISSHYPVWASLAPVSLFLLVSIAAGTTYTRFIVAVGATKDANGYIIFSSYFLLNFGAKLFSLLIMIIPWHSLCWRISRTIIYFLFNCASVGCIIFTISTENNLFDPNCSVSIPSLHATHIFRFNILCTVCCLFLDLFVFPSKELGPKLFSPLTNAFIHGLRKIGSGEFHDQGDNVEKEYQ